MMLNLETHSLGLETCGFVNITDYSFAAANIFTMVPHRATVSSTVTLPDAAFIQFDCCSHYGTLIGSHTLRVCRYHWHAAPLTRSAQNCLWHLPTLTPCSATAYFNSTQIEPGTHCTWQRAAIIIIIITLQFCAFAHHSAI